MGDSSQQQTIKAARQRAQSIGGNPASTPFSNIVRQSQGGADPQTFLRQSLGLGDGQRATPAAMGGAVLNASDPSLRANFLQQHQQNVGTPSFYAQEGSPDLLSLRIRAALAPYTAAKRAGLPPPSGLLQKQLMDSGVVRDPNTPILNNQYVAQPPPPTPIPSPTNMSTSLMSPLGPSQQGIPSTVPSGRPWANSMPSGTDLSPAQMQAFQQGWEQVQASHQAAALAQQRAQQQAATGALMTRTSPGLKNAATMTKAAPAVASSTSSRNQRSSKPAGAQNLSDLAYLVTGLSRSR